MAVIAVIDDNEDQRTTNTRRLQLFLNQLSSTLGVLPSFPLANQQDYDAFIISNDVAALILDEKLHNDSQPDCPPVAYNGSDLVLTIRQRHKNIPVFTLTNFPDDHALQENIGQYDYIFAKSRFNREQVQIIHRACQRYLQEHQSELSLFNELSQRVAAGQGNNEQILQLKALQLKLSIPLNLEINTREELLTEYEKQLSDLNDLKQFMEAALRQK